MVTRRTFLQASTFGLALSTVPTILSASKTGEKGFQLKAKASEHLFYDDAEQSRLWLYNDQTPGPVIRAKKGEMLEVTLHNQLDEPTTIHWHGVRNINNMDGVPGLTQDAVSPGESFIYKFPVNDAGTFWYHAHNKAWSQVARGLYGPLIISEHFDILDARDVVLLVDDWLLDERDQLHTTSLGNLHDRSHGGRHGNFLTVNGSSEPLIKVPSSGPVRLRFISAANARIMRFELNDNLLMRVLSVDGSPCEPFELYQLPLAPGQRVDIIVEDVQLLSALWEVSTDERLQTAIFEQNSSLNSIGEMPKTGEPWYSKPDKALARHIDIHMQGGVMGNLMSAVFDGTERSLGDIARNEFKFWALNGEIGSYDLNLAKVKLGRIVQLNVWNDTQWRHAMHLHGQHFWVKSKEFGKKSRDLLRDTYLMLPGERAELLFVADNPGDWLFHCHMLEHHAAGMGGIISIS
jgi:FtsP/CotA-like multicopper oxidase with cupredoxin domain